MRNPEEPQPRVPLVSVAHLAILSFLPGPDRFRLATLLRIERQQALALYSIRSASLQCASRRGLVDLLAFRLRTAVTRIGSVDPIDSLLWILHAVNVHAPASSSPSMRVEWWIPLDLFGDRMFITDLSRDAIKRALHFAAEYGHVAVLDWWMDHWPRSAHLHDWICDDAVVPGYEEPEMVRVVLNPAIDNGQSNVVMWCGRRFGWSLRHISHWTLKNAARRNHVETLLWLEKEALLPESWFVQLDYGNEQLQLEQLQKRKKRMEAQSLDAEAIVDETADYKETMLHAIAYGHVAVLQLLKDEDRLPTDIGEEMEDAMEDAAESGHIKVLNWLKANNLLSNQSLADLIHAALGAKNVDVLQYSFDNLDPQAAAWSWPKVLELGYIIGEVQHFQWLSEHLPAPDAAHAMAIVSESSRFGDVKLLEWFKQSGYIQPLTCPIVDASRSSKAFDWWKRNKFQLFYDGGPDIKRFIIKNVCNLNLLEWLVEKQSLAGADRCGVPYGEWPQLDLLTVAAASRCGFCYDEDVLNAVEWWAARGAVLDANKTALNQAAAAKNVPFLEWMLLRGMDALLEFEQHVVKTKSEPYESWSSFSVWRWWSEANGRAVEARR